MNKHIEDEFEDHAPKGALPDGLFAAPMPPRSFPQQHMAPQAAVPAAPVNPLLKYYRSPGVHTRLPTNGIFMPGGIEFTMTGDVPVFPMGASEELLLKSPEALMSGYALEQLIRGCVPAIKHPRLVSSPDLDVILLAIRVASSGPIMPMEAKCPKCGHDHAFEVHLPAILSTMKTIDTHITARINDEVVVFCRPYNLSDATQLSLIGFEETRKIQALELGGAAQNEKVMAMNDSYARLAKAKQLITAGCVLAVNTPDGQVQDRSMITEFIQNITAKQTAIIDAAVEEANTAGVDRSIAMTCHGCSHEWKTMVSFDPASFFG